MASRRGTRVLVVQIRQVALASVQPAVGDETCALHRAIPGGEEAAAQTRQTNSGVPLPTGTCRAQSDDDIALRPMGPDTRVTPASLGPPCGPAGLKLASISS